MRFYIFICKMTLFVIVGTDNMAEIFAGPIYDTNVSTMESFAGLAAYSARILTFFSPTLLFLLSP